MFWFAATMSAACGSSGNSASVDAHGAADAALVCGTDTKACAGACVPTTVPANGCGLQSCDPCPAGPHELASCATNGSCTLACATDFWDLDGDASNGCEYSCHKISDLDPIDPAFADDNCDGGDGVVAQCVYVAADGSDAAAGTRLTPVASIAQALTLAQASSIPAVCLSGDTYHETVTVPSGISIYGGFDETNATFKFRRTAGVVTTVQAAGVVFSAPMINADTHVEGLTIDAATPPAPGANITALALGGGTGTLFVRYNVITTAAGATGTPGANGAPPTALAALAGSNGQSGSSASSNGGGGASSPVCTEAGGAGGSGGYNIGNGLVGSPGSGGAGGGSAGVASGACASKSGSGGAGAPGATGVSGSNGPGGNGIGSIVNGAYTGVAGSNGTAGTNGRGGGGGGGGGGGAATVFCNSDRGGGGASGGCGGLGGTFGHGGTPGGASFAIFASAGLLTATFNTFATGNGGVGGPGGTGGTKQTGGAGGFGGFGPDDAGYGGNGSTGGDGGAGGAGGGGRGGPTACVAHASSVTLTFSDNTCTLGAGGIGGAGGSNANAGATGQAIPDLMLP
jgi:hypothetical protein